MKNKLASSGTIAGIEKVINQYFYSSYCTINKDLKICNPNKPQINEFYEVKKEKNRFIFYQK